jgi:hypothetical protein
MKSAIAPTLAILLGVLFWSAAPAAAKGSKDPCRKADAKLALTGQGDADGDGVSDCRENKVLHTMANDPDTDHDGLNDGDEVRKFCNPHKPDTDGDGTEDGDDDSPVIEQKVVAILDALTCPVEITPPTTPPTPPTPGSISALGISVTVDADTEFEHKSCADLVAQLALGQPIVVEIDILEDMLGALTATEVEVRKGSQHHFGGGDHDDHHGDDDDDQGKDD